MASKEGEKKTLREQQLEARRKKMKELNPPVERVRVSPASDDLRKVLKHPNGVKFPESGSVEWPLDQFTRRRIKDGSVKREGSKAQAQQQPAARPQQAPQQTPQQPQQPAAAPQQPPAAAPQASPPTTPPAG